MNVRKVKKKCMVKGCRNTDTFALSNMREFGSSVIICKTCLEQALQAVNEYAPAVREGKVLGKPPALFYHSQKEVVKQEEKQEEPVIEEIVDEGEAEELFLCELCGKEFKTEQGLKRHMKIHEEDVTEGEA